MFLLCFHFRNSLPISTAFISAKYLLLIPETVKTSMNRLIFMMQLYCYEVEIVQSSHLMRMIHSMRYVLFV